MFCKICSDSENNLAKYKCPKCRTPYCSVSCCKAHKNIGCQISVESKVVKPDSSEVYNSEVPNFSGAYNFPTENTVPFGKLKLLEQNQELKNILCNRHLRDMLVAIDKSSNPAASMQQAMLEPIFVEFADECLKVIEPSEG